MSSTDHDMSESSCSPQSQMESPYSSPSQQVPHLAHYMTELSCADPKNVNNGMPFLRILEQPQKHFRFRYRSEMVGTHGCLLGDSYGNRSKTKTHPTVELVNVSGPARIRCRLVQADKMDQHPHRLLEDEVDCSDPPKEVSAVVPEHGSYTVSFAGMGIIHTAKKDVRAALMSHYTELCKNQSINMKALTAQCDRMAKDVNLNIVRLKFSAHDLETDAEICPPICSSPIHNMKSAATNDLKICRISRYAGQACGNEDVFLFVEKVNKKNIAIELTEWKDDVAVWVGKGKFVHTDVHHQFGIVFMTPPYVNPNITSDVKVQITLVRPSDGCRSDPKEFVYKASPVQRSLKRRKMNSYSSYCSSGSLKSIGDIPAPVEMITQDETIYEPFNNIIPAYQESIKLSPSKAVGLADALCDSVSYNTLPQVDFKSPMFSLPGTEVPSLPPLHLSSMELEQLLKDDTNLTADEKKSITECDWADYFNIASDAEPAGSFDFIRSSQIISDSGRAKGQEKSRGGPSSIVKTEVEKKPVEYTGLYKPEDGMEVKKVMYQIVKQLCDALKTRTGFKKAELKQMLERLFELWLSNGDNFLHMTLVTNQPCVDVIVKLVHSMKMTALLNQPNNNMHTILHLAIINDNPSQVSQFIAHGCDPMLEDKDGNNAVHLAVEYQSCLEPLLKAIKTHKVACDLDAYNGEKQTALHRAVVTGCEVSAGLLLSGGASNNARDSGGRSPLHLAAYDDSLNIIKCLLQHIPSSEIDAVDGRGNTALQIVCGAGLKNNTKEIVKLLLDKKSDPLKNESSVSAWQLVKNIPELKQIIKEYLPETICDEDIKSEPEDEFESAEEDEGSVSLPELPLYVREVSARLDARGWRALAARTQLAAHTEPLARAHSPAAALLTLLQESNTDITSKSLALMLEELGEIEAASIIRKYI